MLASKDSGPAKRSSVFTRTIRTLFVVGGRGDASMVMVAADGRPCAYRILSSESSSILLLELQESPTRAYSSARSLNPMLIVSGVSTEL